MMPKMPMVSVVFLVLKVYTMYMVFGAYVVFVAVEMCMMLIVPGVYVVYLMLGSCGV